MDVPSYILGKSRGGGGGTSDFKGVVITESNKSTPAIITALDNEYQKYLNKEPYLVYYAYNPGTSSDKIVQMFFAGNTLYSNYFDKNYGTEHFTYVMLGVTIENSKVTAVGNMLAKNFDTNGATSGTIMLLNNTKSFVPTSDYNPASKKYVDDAVATAGIPVLTLNFNATMSSNNDTIPADITAFQKFINDFLDSNEENLNFIVNTKYNNRLYSANIATTRTAILGTTFLSLISQTLIYKSQHILTSWATPMSLQQVQFNLTYDVTDNHISLANINHNVNVEDMSYYIPGYDSSVTQVLKNIDGVPTWVNE